jgi:Bacterioferritin (cytochrome b1)
MDDKQKQRVIRELNGFLKGRYMGIHQYEHLISQAKDPKLKDLLQRFQHHAKLGAQKIAERIQDLGGKPVDGAGLIGEVREWLQRFKESPQDPKEILHDALIGENKYGIHFSHKLVAGDLDEESANMVDTVLEEDQKRVDELKKLLRQ